MPDAQVLFEAARSGKIDVIKKIFGEHPSKALVETKDEHERTALFFAVSAKQWETAKMLLTKYNADARAMCHCCNTTALSKAAEYGSVELVKLLAERHAPVSQKNANDEVAATLAERFGHDDCVRALRRIREETLDSLRENALNYLTEFVNESSGLDKFYGGDDEETQRRFLEPKARAAALAVDQLLKGGLDMSESVKKLAVLTLYDLVLLIDDSFSIKFEEGGKRLKALEKTLKAVVKTYSRIHSPSAGVRAIRFLNSKKRMDNVQLQHLEDYPIRKHKFMGPTRIGTALEHKVFKEFIPNDGSDLENPLLVVIITDGAIEGERDGLLEETIQKHAEKVERKWGRHSIAFQFARIGNDQAAKEFLEELDRCKTCGHYVSCDTVGLGLNEILKSKSRRRRELIVHVLSGAIYDSDDEHDGDSSDEEKSSESDDGADDDDDD